MIDVKIHAEKLKREYKFDLDGWSFTCEVTNTEDDRLSPIEVLLIDLRAIIATLGPMVEEARRQIEPRVKLEDILPRP